MWSCWSGSRRRRACGARWPTPPAVQAGWCSSRARPGSARRALLRSFLGDAAEDVPGASAAPATTCSRPPPLGPVRDVARATRRPGSPARRGRRGSPDLFGALLDELGRRAPTVLVDRGRALGRRGHARPADVPGRRPAGAGAARTDPPGREAGRAAPLRRAARRPRAAGAVRVALPPLSAARRSAARRRARARHCGCTRRRRQPVPTSPSCSPPGGGARLGGATSCSAGWRGCRPRSRALVEQLAVVPGPHRSHAARPPAPAWAVARRGRRAGCARGARGRRGVPPRARPAGRGGDTARGPRRRPRPGGADRPARQPRSRTSPGSCTTPSGAGHPRWW